MGQKTEAQAKKWGQKNEETPKAGRDAFHRSHFAFPVGTFQGRGGTHPYRLFAFADRAVFCQIAASMWKPKQKAESGKQKYGGIPSVGTRSTVSHFTPFGTF